MAGIAALGADGRHSGVWFRRGSFWRDGGRGQVSQGGRSTGTGAEEGRMVVLG